MDRVELFVRLAYSPRAGEVCELELRLAAGATLRDALRVSGVLQRFAEIDLATTRFGVWGKLSELDRLLRDHDRVEIYRALTVDPKEARRLRYRAHRERFKK
jgi:uncharacterized protein